MTDGKLSKLKLIAVQTSVLEKFPAIKLTKYSACADCFQMFVSF